MKSLLVIYFLAISTFIGDQRPVKQNYLEYHSAINDAEQLMGEERYEDALVLYNAVFKNYDFVFLRDYKIAAQLAFYLDKKEMMLVIIQEGFKSGWELNALRKNKFLSPIKKESGWKALEESYYNLNEIYLSKIDSTLQEIVHTMFKKDQKKALGALFRIGDKLQVKYAERKFAPHSEEQMFKLIEILKIYGYPGEKIIGNDFWMATIISHHNSISEDYAKKDTLYAHIRPALKKSLENGEISPYEFALIDDWHKITKADNSEAGYGFIDNPVNASLSETDLLRSQIGLRSVELRNKLVEIEEKTGMNFYLPDWVEGKIIIE